VNGRSNADAAHTVQVNEAGNVFDCLMQVGVNLTSPPVPADCSDTTAGSPPFTSQFTNAPFSIETYIRRTRGRARSRASSTRTG
jgi:hypothetical protein